MTAAFEIEFLGGWADTDTPPSTPWATDLVAQPITDVSFAAHQVRGEGVLVHLVAGDGSVVAICGQSPDGTSFSRVFQPAGPPTAAHRVVIQAKIVAGAALNLRVTIQRNVG